MSIVVAAAGPASNLAARRHVGEGIVGMLPTTEVETAMTLPRPPKTVSSLLLAAALLGSLAAGPAEAAMYRRVVAVAPGHVAWIHRSPDGASQRVGYLRSGTLRVLTFGCRKLAKGGWCHVERRGTRGWVQDRYLATGAVMRG